MMNKVLFLTYHLPTPGEAGAGRPWGEATMLKELDYSIEVITSGAHYLTGESTRKHGHSLWSVEEQADIKIIKTYAPKGFRKSLVKRLFNYAVYSFLSLLKGISIRSRYVFIGTDPLFIVPIGYILSIIHRAHLVLDERDLYPDTAVALGIMKPGIVVDFLERWQNFVRRRAHHIVAATPGIKKMLIEKGVDPGKITVMINAFPPQNTSVVSPAFLEKFKDEVVIFYGGGMGMANDLFTILEAARILEKKALPTRFLFIGTGEYLNNYLEYCRLHGLTKCQFLSTVPRSEIPAFLRRADICVHALKANPFWRCALSSKILDYLAYEKPVVFSGQGDIADLLHTSQGGISVPPEDPSMLAQVLEDLCKDATKRIGMGYKGGQYMREHFSHAAQRECLGMAFRA